MKVVDKRCWAVERGFSLTELLVALLVTVIVMMAVLMLLSKGQASFQREPEVADMNQNARAALDMISRDLTMAGYQTPPSMSIIWSDGGGIIPDELTIVYADPTVPTARTYCPNGSTNTSSNSSSGDGSSNQSSNSSNDSPCNTVCAEGFDNGRCGGSDLFVEPRHMHPQPADPTGVYEEGQTLFVVETEDCNGDGLGMVPITLAKPPEMKEEHLVDGSMGNILLVTHENPDPFNPPQGYVPAVDVSCAVIGVWNMIQYRINPLPPADNPVLERRDWASGEDWTPVANNIENLQVQYGVGSSTTFVDEPPTPPLFGDPNTWITRVRVTIGGRSASTNLQGASAGVFDPGDTHIRKTFSTVVSLRNQVHSAMELDPLNWN